MRAEAVGVAGPVSSARGGGGGNPNRRLPRHPVMTRGTTKAILRQIEDLGYAVSVHHMREYVELHAVRLSGDEIPHVARCEGDGEEELYQAASALAEMVGVRLDE